MEYNSFYGGRRGASFVIVKNYKCITVPDEDNEVWNKIICDDMGLAVGSTISTKTRTSWLSEYCMAYCFQQGGDYTTVNYDEYVMITPPNLNDSNNGKIYRRGYDYTNDLGGAIYIGQVCGPAGMSPQVEMSTYADVEALGEDGWIDEDGNIYDVKSGEYAPTENLIPGQYIDDDGNFAYNDSIKWISCSIQDEYSHHTTVYLGFIVPYMVTDYTSESVSPYYHRSDLEPTDLSGEEKWTEWDTRSETEHGDGTTDFNNKELIERTDDQTHPYFEKWNISIPKGIKGETLNNFRITTVEEETGKDIELQEYDGMDDDSETDDTKKRQILVYDYYNYDRDPSGDPIALYLGDYNMIDNFAIDEYGTVTIDYSHDDQDIYQNLFKWVKSISLNAETGFFEITYNYDKTRDGEELAKEDTTLQMYLTWVKDIDFSEDGTISWTYTTSENDKTYDNFIKWITSVQLNAETGLFEIDFNYETDPDTGEATHYEQSLQWVKDIAFAEDGTVTLTYTNQDDTVYTNLMKWITSVSLDPDNGHLTVVYNYDEEEDGTPTIYEQDLRWVNEVTIDEYGTITFDYTNGEDTVYEQYIKTITNTSLDPETGKFIITYNYLDEEGAAATYEQDLRWVKEVSITDEGTITFDYTNGDDTVYEQYIQTIISTELNKDTGELTVTYNTLDEEGNNKTYNTSLTWVKDITISEDGTITMIYTDQNDVTYDNYIKTIVSTTLDPETGEFIITYNTPDAETGEAQTYNASLTWVKDITIAEDGTVTMIYTNQDDVSYEYYIKTIQSVALDTENGHFTVTYNYPGADGITPATYETDLKYVKDVTLDDEGTLSFHYTTGEQADYEYYVKSVSSVTLDAETGEFVLTYNYPDDSGNPTTYTTNLKWVDGISLASDGTVTVHYTTSETVDLEEKITWIDDLDIGEDGSVTLTYNDGTTKTWGDKIKWMNGLSVAEDGSITITYNDGSSEVLEGALKFITDLSLAEDGTFTVTYNNGDDPYTTTLKWPVAISMDSTTYELIVTYNDNTTEVLGTLVSISDVQIDTGDTEGEGTQKVNVTYSTGTTEEIGNPLNYIMQTALSNDYHLLVLYSDPARREEIVAAGENASYDGRDDWYDLGYLGQGTTGAIASTEDDETAAAIAASMPTYSTWFIIEEEEDTTNGE